MWLALAVLAAAVQRGERDQLRQDQVAVSAQGGLEQVQAASHSGVPDELILGDPDVTPDLEYVRYVGTDYCFPLQPTTDKVDDSPVLYDDRCACFKDTADNTVGKTSCASGLPFYRYRSNFMTMNDCGLFCVSKGLDLFGIVQSTECRCGATDSNLLIWHQQHTEPEKMKAEFGKTSYLRPDIDKASVPSDPDNCQAVIYKYNGNLEDGGIPPDLVTRRKQDTDYIDGIVFQLGCSRPEEPLGTAQGQTYVDFNEETALCGEPDPAHCMWEQVDCTMEKSAEECPGLCRMCVPPTMARDCDEVNCDRESSHCGCLPGEPWPFKSKDTGDRIIPYVADWTVDAIRMHALHKAMAAISARSCIRFRSIPIAIPDVPYLRVMASKDSACRVDGIGMPRHGDLSRELNLFACDSELFVGDIIHELMHVLGFDDEIRRPDAFHTVDGKGPYLKMVDGRDPPAYNARSYMGSGMCGVSAFDYRSIMMPSNNAHAHRVNNVSWTTIPLLQGSTEWLGSDGAEGMHDPSIGNRQSLSDSDAERLRCAYSCPASEPSKPCMNVFELADGPGACATAIKDLVSGGQCTEPEHCCVEHFCPTCDFRGMCDKECSAAGLPYCTVNDNLVKSFRSSLSDFAQRIDLLKTSLGEATDPEQLTLIYNSLVKELAFLYTLQPGVS